MVKPKYLILHPLCVVTTVEHVLNAPLWLSEYIMVSQDMWSFVTLSSATEIWDLLTGLCSLSRPCGLSWPWSLKTGFTVMP